MVDLTFYGHSTFLAKIEGLKVLFDPFITGNDKAGDIDLKSINPDIILVTHAHQDHILDVEAIATQSGAKLISNFEIVSYFQGKGLKNAHPVNHGGSVDLGGGVRAKYVNAVHTSSFPDGAYGGQPGGFVLSWDGGAFYYSGDTALHQDMKQIAEEYALDFACLCLGDNFTMGYEDAIKAARYVGAKRVFGMHFDTFTPIDIDHDTVKGAFDNAGLALTLPEIGKTYQL